LPWLFGLTLFAAAALLFAAQPLVGKSLLPLWGGSPSVWNTCMVFFQAALLAGYVYAHVATAWLGVRRQAVLHGALLLAGGAFLPLAAPGGPPAAAHPAAALLAYLAATVGPPFFVVATTAPLLQRWFAGVDPRDPYPLYAASNLGSLLALAAYPLAIEPRLGLHQQRAAWAWGYGALVGLVWICAALVWRKSSLTQSPAAEDGRAERPSTGRAARWVALAFVPSSWLLGVTTYVTTDIAPAPLLWVVPLGLYLLSFVLVFARATVRAGEWAERLLPVLALPLGLALGLGLAQPFWLPLHLLTFFVGALACHGLLAHDRPRAVHLTAFYLALAVGGLLGGLFNALAAPWLFDRIAEYPLALVLGCLALPAKSDDGGRWPALSVHSVWLIPLAIFGLIAALVRNVAGIEPTLLGAALELLASGLVVFTWYRHRRRPARFALGLGAALLASGLSDGPAGRTLFRARNFFGTVRVTVADTPRGAVHRLFHGNTLHGQQALDRARRREPLAYFHRTSPIARILGARRLPGDVAIVGLGAGALAAYAQPGERWTFYEIDPAVIRVARDPRYFTYLSDSRAARVEVVEGDARLRLRAATDRAFGVIVLDAFSSDAVPTHLLTREALALYRAKLAPAGLVAFNITNRYLDLEPVVGALARDAGMACRVRYDVRVSDGEKAAGKQPSIWAVLAGRAADLGEITRDPLWTEARLPPGTRAWRDDFSDPARHLFLWRRPIGTTRSGRVP
jgi:hypothetical protein